MRKINTFKAKRGIVLLVAMSLITFPVFAQTKAQVFLKFSKQEGQMRIVLEAEESFIEKTKTDPSPSQIIIEFPGPFHLVAPENFPFEIVAKDKGLLIKVEEQAEIKIFRLSSPTRLVFDIRTGDKFPSTIFSRVFVFDPGHGGYDSGITSGDIKEKDISLGLAKHFEEILSKKGKKVFLTRKADQYVSLIDRIKFVNQKKPEIFISLHSSLSENFVIYTARFEERTPDEVSALYSLSSRQKKYIKKSKALADCLGKAIKDDFRKGILYREMPLPILVSADAPSVLIEYPSSKFVTYDQQMKTKLVAAILKGIAAMDNGKCK